MTNSLWSTEWTYFQNAFSSNSCTQTLIWLKKNACSVKNKDPLIQSKHRRIIFAGIWNTLFYLKFTNLSLEKGQYKGKQDYHSLFKEWNKKKTFSEETIANFSNGVGFNHKVSTYPSDKMMWSSWSCFEQHLEAGDLVKSSTLQQKQKNPSISYSQILYHVKSTQNITGKHLTADQLFFLC